MKFTPSKGKWFPYPPDPEVEICIKRMPSASFDGSLEWYDKAMLNWRGIQDEEGNQIPCTTEAKEFVLFGTDEGGELSLWILQKAMSWDEFIDFEEVKKKFQKLSNGALASPKPAETSAESA